jgi:triosephosphate isomerase (TIM)
VRQRLVIGNWKLNGSLAKNAALLSALKAQQTSAIGAVCVPMPYLAQTQAALAGSCLAWGAQNVSEHASGAYTGEVSAEMLAEFGCKYVLVGHSERRAMFGDTDAVVAAKFARALAAGLTPVLCLGESLAERDAGITESVVQRQLLAVANVVGAAAMQGAILAYEPVWAIGTGKTASPEQAQDVHAFLRGCLRKLAEDSNNSAPLLTDMPILYGGSVKASNAAAIFAKPDVDGGLIGGAALVAEDFLAIWSAA